jgi:glucosylceramidase
MQALWEPMSGNFNCSKMKRKLPVLILVAYPALLPAQSKSDPVKPATFKTITVYTTAEKTDHRLSKTATLTLKAFGQPLETQPCVFIDAAKKFQAMTGIGGAITDASAETFARLPEAAKQELLTAYFNKDKGIGYSLIRTNINSCDFSSDTYTYVADNDAALKTFNIAHDETYRIPMIKQAIKEAGGRLPLFVSPWSPPAWMKDNNNMLQGGKLKAAFRDSWANYYVKYIRAYESRGIPVWGLSVQNEPMAKQRWESCIWSAEEERDFIKNHLGPTLQKQGMGNKKLIAWDHNRDLLYQRATTILNDPAAARYVWGIGFHWYETWTGSAMQFENLKRVHETFPDKNLIFTEGCVEKFDLNRIHDWSIGERYGYSMINDFNSGTVAWTDWNILLDEQGGPNHVGNFCFAPVHADTKTGKLIYTNAYYYLGHFSKFIHPGARRIGTACSRDKIAATAFMNPNGKIVVVVLNLSNDAVDYNLWINGNAAATTSLPHSIATMVIE